MLQQSLELPPVPSVGELLQLVFFFDDSVFLGRRHSPQARCQQAF